jgi:hypothetical protein
VEFFDKGYNMLPSLDRYQMYRDASNINQGMVRHKSEPYFGSMYGGEGHPQRVHYRNAQTYNMLSQNHMM